MIDTESVAKKLNAILNAKPDVKIWFVHVHFDKQVHAQGLGFTDNYFLYVMGVNEQDIKQRVEQWCEHYCLSLVRLSCSFDGVKQNPNAYTFPEQILISGS